MTINASPIRDIRVWLKDCEAAERMNLKEVGNSESPLAVPKLAASSSATLLRVTGNEAFDRAASRGERYIEQLHAGFLTTPMTRTVEGKVGIWGIALQAIEQADAQLNRDDGSPQSIRLNTIEAKLDALKAALAKQDYSRITALTRSIDTLIRAAFICSGPARCFEKMFQHQLYDEIKVAVAERLGGDLGEVEHLSSEINPTLLATWDDLIETGMSSTEGLDVAMRCFFKIPLVIKEGRTDGPAPASSLSNPGPNAWKPGLAPQNVNTVTNTNNIDLKPLADMLKPVFDLLAQLLRERGHQGGTIAAVRPSDDLRYGERADRDTRTDDENKAGGSPSFKRATSVSHDNNLDSLSGRSEVADEVLSSLRQEAFSSAKTNLGSVASELRNVSSAVDGSTDQAGNVRRLSMVGVQGRDDENPHLSNQIHTTDHSPLSASTVKLLPLTPHGHIYNSSNVSRLEGARRDHNGFVQNRKYDLRLSTSATGPTVSIDELRKTGKEADESGSRDAPRGAWLYQNEWAKPRINN